MQALTVEKQFVSCQIHLVVNLLKAVLPQFLTGNISGTKNTIVVAFRYLQIHNAQAMKQLLFLTLLSFTLASAGFGQTKLDIRQLVLVKPDKKSFGLHLGESPAQCMRALGQPEGISDYYSEIDNDTLDVFHYGKNTITFQQNRLVSWKLRDDKIGIKYANGPLFKTGDLLASKSGSSGEQTNYKFLNLDVIRKAGMSQNMHFESALVIWLKDGPIQLDSHMELLFDSKNKLFSISILD